jgi:hypothetical protein
MKPQKVDIVYSWSGIPNKNVQRSDSPQRYRYNSELQYSLRSLFKYAKWVNHIYILINPTTLPPYWLKQNDWITVVNRCELFDNPKNCPTYNSMAVHAICHKIKGLSNHFIIFDDDIFLKNEVDINYFFNKDGAPVVRQPHKKMNVSLELWQKALSSSDLKKDLTKFPEYKFASHSHRPKPISIDLIDIFNKEYPGVSELIQSHVYREYGLEFMTDMLYYEFFYNQKLIDYRENDETFVQFGVSHNFNEISFRRHKKLIDKTNIKCFNINDNWSLDNETYLQQMKLLADFFINTYPQKPYFEI